MPRTCLTMVLLLAVGSLLPLRAVEMPALHPYNYEEGFETDNAQLALWASNGSASTIAFNGPTEEKAYAGKRSLKLDITLGDGSYYYLGIPLRVPCAGKLKLSARVFVAEGTTATALFKACPNNDGGTSLPNNARVKVVVKDVNGNPIRGIAAADICLLFNGGTPAQGFSGVGADSVIANSTWSPSARLRNLSATMEL